MAEIFRQFLYDYKKNRTRSRGSIIGAFALFGLLVFGLLGGFFIFLSLQLVDVVYMGFGWMYFLIFGMLGIVLGIVGSIFNTYAGLYLAKDNDFLLSLPIPARTIVASRVFSVFLMGLLYSGTVTLPAAAVYIIKVPQTALSVVGALLTVLIVSAIVFVLSCLLGWVVAKISVKLKGRGFVKVAISLVLIALYYVVYFKAMDLVKGLIANIATYGAAVKGSAYPLYLFGRVGEGDPLAIAIFTGGAILLVALTLTILSKTFFKIVLASSDAPQMKYKVKENRVSGQTKALLSKEYHRFKSSVAYMLNASLGTVLLPVVGVFFIIKSEMMSGLLREASAYAPYGAGAALCAIICFFATMNMITTPSVSLEGGSLWIVRTLPVETKKIIFAKLSLHVLLTLIPALFCSLCAVFALDMTMIERVFVIIVPAVFSVASGAVGLAVGLRRPNLTWTQEIVPIKQSIDPLFTMIANFLMVALPALVFFAFIPTLGVIHLVILLAVYAAIATFTALWLMKSGVKKFESL